MRSLNMVDVLLHRQGHSPASPFPDRPEFLSPKMRHDLGDEKLERAAALLVC
jgi:hypothetical protein